MTRARLQALDDAELVEHLFVALTLGLPAGGRLAREVKRRGLLDRVLALAAERTRAERRRLGEPAPPSTPTAAGFTICRSPRKGSTP